MSAKCLRILAAACLLAGLLETLPIAAQQPLSAQADQAARGTTQPPYPSPWSGVIRWLVSPAVQKDLELIDEQVEQVTKIRQEMQQEMQQSYKNLSSVPAQERQQQYRDMNAELAERTEKKLMEVLLPEQRDRLQQITLQMRLRSYWALGQQLTSEDLAKRLGISEEQKDRLLTLQQELREEIQQKTREFHAKINQEAEKKIFEALTSAQRRELEAMMGERFEWSPWNTPPQSAPKR